MVLLSFIFLWLCFKSFLYFEVFVTLHFFSWVIKVDVTSSDLPLDMIMFSINRHDQIPGYQLCLNALKIQVVVDATWDVTKDGTWDFFKSKVSCTKTNLGTITTQRLNAIFHQYLSQYWTCWIELSTENNKEKQTGGQGLWMYFIYLFLLVIHCFLRKHFKFFIDHYNSCKSVKQLRPWARQMMACAESPHGSVGLRSQRRSNCRWWACCPRVSTGLQIFPTCNSVVHRITLHGGWLIWYSPPYQSSYSTDGREAICL